MSLPSLNIYHREAYPAISPDLPALNQAGKVVLITGAGSGIGFAIARAFVLAGADKVIMLGRRPDVIRNAASKLNAETGRSSAEGRVADAFDFSAIDALWSDLNKDGTYVDVLVLNAASFGATKPILQASQEDTWQAFEANVRSPLAMAINFAKQTTGSSKKVIHSTLIPYQASQLTNESQYLVNVSTIAAYMWSTMAPDRPTYGLTKNAGTLLLQQIAKDTSPDEMQVVSYHPGGIFTEAAYASGLSENGTIKWENGESISNSMFPDNT